MGKLSFIFFIVLALNFFDTPYADVTNNHNNTHTNCITYDCTVHIMSAVNNLQFHCHSKDDDLGDVVRNAGEEFDIKFCLDFWRRSLFTCHFNRESKQKEFDVFKMPPIGETQNYCFRWENNLNCYWKVQEDGFYIPQAFDPLDNWVKIFDWE